MNDVAPTIALMSPGDMGHAVANVLMAGGLRVITSLAGRSERTRALARKIGIEAVVDDDVMVAEADILLSILVPARAEALAARLAPAIEKTARDLVYVDCNAIAPATSRRLAATVEAAGGIFVDAGIIGPPPKPGGTATRFYASGEQAERFAALGRHGLDVRVIGARIGDASAVKMCYAALTKGTTALMTGLSVAAERMGIGAALQEEFQLSQPAMFERMRGQVPAMVPKAHRWIGEMEEIAKTFEQSGLTPKMFEGAAAIYGSVAGSTLGRISQESWNQAGKDYADVVADLAAAK